MSRIQKYLLSFFENDDAESGLFRDSAGESWVRAADGTTTKLPGSGGGSGGLPIADPTGVTVDTTTYDNPIPGGSAKLTTLVFPNLDGAVFALAQSGAAFPSFVWELEGSQLFFGDGTFDPVSDTECAIGFSGGGFVEGGNTFPLFIDKLGAATAGRQPSRLDQVSPLHTITAGPLPVVDFTGMSGVGQQVSLTRDADIYVETATAGSVVAELSPDGVTYSTIYTRTVAATDCCYARVPAGWWLKLTATTAVLGLGTYA